MKEMEFAPLILPQKFSFPTAALTGAHAKVQHEDEMKEYLIKGALREIDKEDVRRPVTS